MYSLPNDVANSTVVRSFSRTIATFLTLYCKHRQVVLNISTLGAVLVN